ncbi:MAG: hypothetical protein IT242_02600 [Bacteroidia bacterium]|nr:hypothetical protein [Bacteroidia bacterium]
MKKFPFRFLLLTVVFPAIYFQTASSQEPSGRKPLLDSLIHCIQRGPDDSSRSNANRIFASILKDSIDRASFFTDTGGYFKNVSVQISTDHLVAVYTWSYPSYNGDRYYYFGWIQHRYPDTDSITTYQLNDSTETISRPSSVRLNPGTWLGAVYYELIPVRMKKMKYYTLIGWKGKNQFTTQKIVDVLYFDRNGAHFGLPVFKTGSVYKSRLIYSFNSMATMTIHYDPSRKRMLLDHLSQVSGSNEDPKASASGPDGSYDQLRLRKGKWYLSRDIDARNEKMLPADLPEPPVIGNSPE